MGITPEGRYELRRVGKSTTTKAAQKQLRQWPNDWSLNMNMPELLETFIKDLMQVNNILNHSLMLEAFTVCAVWNVESLSLCVGKTTITKGNSAREQLRKWPTN